MAGSDAHPHIGTKLGSRDTADRPQTAIEWCVLGLLALSLLSYPFYLKFLAFGTYQAGILLLFAAMLLLFLAQPSYGWQLISNRAPAPVTFFAVMYAAYFFFFMLLASLFHRDIGDPAVELARSITKIAFATILYVSVRTSVFRWLFDRFTQLITITAAAAVLLHSLLFFRAVSPIMTLHLAEDGVSESRNFYLLGLTWGHILTVGGHGFIRLQSFSDEPGTYAFALLVAIIWAIRMKWKWSSAVMVCALALTLSAGGIITGLLLLIVLLPRQSLITKAALVLLVSLAAWGVASINSPFFNRST